MMKYKLALIQSKGNPDRDIVKKRMKIHVEEAVKCGGEVIVLPEMWNCPYSNDFFREYAEPSDGPSVDFMSSVAKECGVYLIGGSIPEIDRINGKEAVYNTSFSFGPDGKMIGSYRKVHLFDISIKGGIRFMESDTITAGDSITLIDTKFGKIGIAICYDVRFPAMFAEMKKRGADLIVLPGAFNMTTGPAHWHLLMRTRALDNQVYFAACSTARDTSSVYTAYGHSCIINPWGEFCAATDSNESIIYADIDSEFIEHVRQQIPVSSQEQLDIFD